MTNLVSQRVCVYQAFNVVITVDPGNMLSINMHALHCLMWVHVCVILCVQLPSVIEQCNIDFATRRYKVT
jgi:hypothetical protein